MDEVVSLSFCKVERSRFRFENRLDLKVSCFFCKMIENVLHPRSYYRVNIVLNFYRVLVWSIFLFSSPDPKGHVSYSHHLASVVVVRRPSVVRPSSVVRRKLFQKSSPLKVLDQWKPNLVWIITRVSSFKIVSGDAVHQPTWPLLLKIEHMVK